MQVYSVVALLLVVALVSFGGAEAGRCQTCPCLMMSQSESCLNGGTCRMSRGTAICVCGDNYRGNRCQERTPLLLRTNPCLSNPCQNSGYCMRRRSGFSCVCTNGYTGETCATTDPDYVNPCDNNNCDSNQRCQPWSIGNHYSCVPV